MSPLSAGGLASRLSLRRAGASILGVAALTLVALSPAGASADGSGTFALSAHLCETEAAATTPDNCDLALEVGDVEIVSEDGSLVYTRADASLHGANFVWGEAGDMPLGLYFIDLEGLDVPDGYQLWNGRALLGETGGSEFGWYANTSDAQPNAQLDLVMIPTQVDSDGDGASDQAEIDFGSDPFDPASFPYVQAGPELGSDYDGDGDGLTDKDEVEIYGTDPSATDTDGDGISDYDEVWAGNDPLDPNIYPGSDPGAGPELGSDFDSDGDGLTDKDEVGVYGTDPNSADSDGDGVSDYDEVANGPTAGPELGSDFDTDGDGLTDKDEVETYGTDPNSVDSDGDGADDAVEIAYGSNPLNANDHPRPTSAEGTSAAVTGASVSQLPNTGTGGGSADGSFASIIAATLGAAALAIFGAVASRRRA